MTNKKAIEWLKLELEKGVSWDDTSESTKNIREQAEVEIKEAFDMAIKALEQHPCEDCISRQAVIKLLSYDWANRPAHKAVESVKNLPSVTPKEKTGRWIFHESFDNGRKNCNECIECSQCHTWLGHDCYAKTPYCPMCGARMVEPQESEEKE